AWTLLSLLTLVCLIVLVGLLWARSDSGREKIRTFVLRKAHETLPGLEIGRIGGDFTRTVVLFEVEIRDTEGRAAVRVARLAVRYDLAALVHRTLRIESVTLEDPALLVRPGKDGRFNLTELVVPSGEQQKASGRPWALEIHEIALVG